MRDNKGTVSNLHYLQPHNGSKRRKVAIHSSTRTRSLKINSKMIEQLAIKVKAKERKIFG